MTLLHDLNLNNNNDKEKESNGGWQIVETLHNDIPVLIVIKSGAGELLCRYVGFDSTTLTYVYLPSDFWFLAFSQIDNHIVDQILQYPYFPLEAKVPFIKLQRNDINTAHIPSADKVFEMLNVLIPSMVKQSSIVVPDGGGNYV